MGAAGAAAAAEQVRPGQALPLRGRRQPGQREGGGAGPAGRGAALGGWQLSPLRGDAFLHRIPVQNALE